MSIIVIRNKIFIPYSELQFKFVRSSGPGGQNVNKVNSKAVLMWDVFSSLSIDHETKERVIRYLKNKINSEGILVLSSDLYRDQLKNKEDCLEKFNALLNEATFVPKVRKKTKITYSSKLKAINTKKSHSRKKKERKISKSDY